MSQCKVIATSTNERCRNDAIEGTECCYFHRPGGHPSAEVSHTSPGLSEDEQKRFLAAFGFVEQEIYERTLKRVRNHYLLVTGIVLAVWASAGTILAVGVRDKAVESVTKELSSDIELRKQVADGAQSRIDNATELLDRSRELTDAIEKEAARHIATLSPSVREISFMLDQLMEEIGHTRTEAARRREIDDESSETSEADELPDLP
ncbi:MAG: hypothetical protein H8E66_20680 [Planctomycetes bacterium]|nr:hypothetical protein [Planctomycetota bacterium]